MHIFILFYFYSYCTALACSTVASVAWRPTPARAGAVSIIFCKFRGYFILWYRHSSVSKYRVQDMLDTARRTFSRWERNIGQSLVFRNKNSYSTAKPLHPLGLYRQCNMCAKPFPAVHTQTATSGKNGRYSGPAPLCRVLWSNLLSVFVTILY